MIKKTIEAMPEGAIKMLVQHLYNQNIALEKRMASLERKKISQGKGLTDEQWLDYLGEVYNGIDIQREFLKCQAYFPHLTISRKRFLNWLNRADKPVNGNGRHKDPEWLGELGK